jgi:hypothetical protein
MSNLVVFRNPVQSASAADSSMGTALLCKSRWGNPEFGKYVQQLQQQADEALQQSPDFTKAAKEAVEKVAELECGFWSMAFSAE